jgi:hypothetical protein
MAKFNEYRWYVYVLIDPRDGKPFYVGKGTGDRMHNHESMVRRGAVDNANKCQRIREIIESGASVEYLVSADFFDEQAAYAHEAELIAEYGEMLTNISHGRQDRNEWVRESGRSLLARVMPFDEWKRNVNSKYKLDEKWYWSTVEEIKMLTCYGAH